MAVRRLEQATARLLTCSAVATSVHAVVKELVENSLDAAASSIQVKLEKFGLDAIEVRDNGNGVEKKDAPLVALPHFTSKLSSFAELSSLESYGFRGEALSSIAAVASLKLTTCSASDDIATTYIMDHSGQVVATQPSHLGQGTTVAVSHLFRNLPVRRQVLTGARQSREELRRVEELLLGFAIAHPQVRFILKHDGKEVWQKMATVDFKTNLSLILGSSAMQRMVSFNWHSFDPMVKMLCYVPKPSPEDLGLVTRATSDRVFVIVNQRPVTVKPFTKLVRAAFQQACETSRWPVAVLMVEVPPADLDVNLEPNKSTVLLHNMDFILSSLSSQLQELYHPTSPEQSQKHADTDGIAAGNPLQDNPPELLDVSDLAELFTESASSSLLDEHVANQVGKSGESLDNRSSDGSPKDGMSGDISPRGSCSEDDDLDKFFTESASVLDEEEMVASTKKSDCKDSGDVISKGSGISDVGRVEPVGTSFTLSQWSRGEAWKGRDMNIQPVKLLQPSLKPLSSTKRVQSKLSYKRPLAVYDLINTRPVKRRAVDEPVGSGGCKRLRPEESTEPISQDVLASSSGKLEELMPFDISTVSQRLAEVERFSSSPRCPPDSVVGYCDPPGVWLVLVSGDLACCRLQSECGAEPTKGEVEAFLKLARDSEKTDQQLGQCFHIVCSVI